MSEDELELETLNLRSVRNSGSILTLRDAAFGTKEEGALITHGINMEIRRSSFTMVIGKVGSGKSTLLKGLIGELPIGAGSMRGTFKETAYCEQQPWLVNDTIQNNILGHSTLEAKWYETVINSCALDRDFATLPSGGLTLVGSKGISLSGGQKARVVSSASSFLTQN
jgi:ABC-type bacteriocin/lantibiotic exporter with double-glycine peptidase domain